MVFFEYVIKFQIIVVRIISSFILNKRKRKAFRNKLLEQIPIKQSILAKNYLKKHLPQYSIEDINREILSEKKINTEELPVWQLWLQGKDNAPTIVKNCMKSVEYFITDRKIIRLDAHNIKDYIDIPDFINNKYKSGIISHTHYSDVIRIYLLDKYGGTWIDSTVMMTGKIPTKILDAPFFAFSSPVDSDYYDTHLISNWFLHAQPQNILVNLLKKSMDNYWKNENRLVDYYIQHLLFKNLIDSHYILTDYWNNLYTLLNDKPHILQGHLYSDFNINTFDKIKNDIFLHKLSYKEKNEKEGTFLDVLSDSNFISK